MTLLQGVTTPRPCRLLTIALLLLTAGLTPAQEGRLGLFTDQTDIGAPKHDGVVARDTATGAYTIGGGGANMWARADSFHFVWKKVEGDIAIEAAVFSKVMVGPPSAEVTKVRSSLEYVKIPSGDRVCVYPGREKITAVAWPAGSVLLFAQKSGAFRVLASGGQADAADATVVPGQPVAASPDGKWTATYEHQGGEAVLTLRPVAGGEARVLMRLPDQADAPPMISWSPDSTKIAYVRYQPGLK